MKKICAGLFFAVILCMFTASCGKSSSSTDDVYFPPGLLPAEYYKIQVGMTEDQIKSILGTPKKVSINKKYEVKTQSEWDQLKSQYESEKQAQMDPSALADPKFETLGKELEHRVKEVWVYYPKDKVWAAISFDGQGKLLTAGSGVAATGMPSHA